MPPRPINLSMRQGPKHIPASSEGCGAAGLDERGAVSSTPDESCERSRLSMSQRRLASSPQTRSTNVERAAIGKTSASANICSIRVQRSLSKNASPDAVRTTIVRRVHRLASPMQSIIEAVSRCNSSGTDISRTFDQNHWEIDLASGVAYRSVVWAQEITVMKFSVQLNVLRQNAAMQLSK